MVQHYFNEDPGGEGAGGEGRAEHLWIQLIKKIHCALVLGVGGLPLLLLM